MIFVAHLLRRDFKNEINPKREEALRPVAARWRHQYLTTPSPIEARCHFTRAFQAKSERIWWLSAALKQCRLYLPRDHSGREAVALTAGRQQEEEGLRLKHQSIFQPPPLPLSLPPDLPRHDHHRQLNQEIHCQPQLRQSISEEASHSRCAAHNLRLRCRSSD